MISKMPPPEASTGRRPRSRRRTVRIVEPGSTTRTATVSFLITVAAAVLLFVVWRFWRAEEPAVPPLPGPGEITLDWKCPAGHTFGAPAQVEPHPCTLCGHPAYPFGVWKCEEDGEFEVHVRLQLDTQGVLRPLEYRILPHGEWGLAGETLACPVCGKHLKRKIQDPLKDLLRRKKKRGTTPPRGG